MKTELTIFLQEALQAGCDEIIQSKVRRIKPKSGSRTNGWLITFFYLDLKAQAGKQYEAFIPIQEHK